MTDTDAMIVEPDGVARPAAVVSAREITERSVWVDDFRKTAEHSLVCAVDDGLVTIYTNVVPDKGRVPLAAIVPIEVYDAWKYERVTNTG